MILFLLIILILYFAWLWYRSDNDTTSPGPAPDPNRIYEGIDVSVWQGNIDFDRVRDAGIEVVYIRSSYGTYTDRNFFQNYERARAAGLKVGFYHFVNARTAEAARQEAMYFVALTENLVFECKHAMDFEEFGSLSVSQINQVGNAFMEVLDTMGVEGCVYSNVYTANNIWNNYFTAYPLWVAQWGREEPNGTGNWRDWAGFQYSATGTVPGIVGDVDLDKFKSTIFVGQ